MIKKNNSYNIDLILLSRYFVGEATPDECKFIEEWVAKSEKNKSLVQRVYNLLYTSDTLHVMNGIDAGVVLKMIKSRIRKTNRANKL